MLRRTDYEVVVSSELRLSSDEATAFDGLQPCLAVIDAGDTLAAVNFIHNLRNEQRSMNLLVLLPHWEDAVNFSLLRLGVRGLLAYEQAPRELCRAATQVGAGGYWVPRELLTRFVEAILPELQGCKSLDNEVDISRREHEVLDLLLGNLSNKEIAHKLFVAERTVKFHVSNLLNKFKVQRRADLIVLWVQRQQTYQRMPHDLERSASLQVN